MREQNPKERIKNFREVPHGYNVEEAVAEREPVADQKELAL